MARGLHVDADAQSNGLEAVAAHFRGAAIEAHGANVPVALDDNGEWPGGDIGEPLPEPGDVRLPRRRRRTGDVTPHDRELLPLEQKLGVGHGGGAQGDRLAVSREPGRQRAGDPAGPETVAGNRRTPGHLPQPCRIVGEVAQGVRDGVGGERARRAQVDDNAGLGERSGNVAWTIRGADHDGRQAKAAAFPDGAAAGADGKIARADQAVHVYRQAMGDDPHAAPLHGQLPGVLRHHVKLSEEARRAAALENDIERRPNAAAATQRQHDPLGHPAGGAPRQGPGSRLGKGGRQERIARAQQEPGVRGNEGRIGAGRATERGIEQHVCRMPAERPIVEDEARLAPAAERGLVLDAEAIAVQDEEIAALGHQGPDRVGIVDRMRLDDLRRQVRETRERGPGPGETEEAAGPAALVEGLGQRQTSHEVGGADAAARVAPKDGLLRHAYSPAPARRSLRRYSRARTRLVHHDDHGNCPQRPHPTNRERTFRRARRGGERRRGRGLLRTTPADVLHRLHEWVASVDDRARGPWPALTARPVDMANLGSGSPPPCGEGMGVGVKSSSTPVASPHP